VGRKRIYTSPSSHTGHTSSQCPMSNTQCPMPNAQYPTSNDSIDLGSIVEKNKCLQSCLTSGSWVYSLV
nr:hypothetical protein [Nostoc sp. CreGUA01]